MEQSDWFDNQPELIEQIEDFINSDERFLVISAPTGAGKSVLPIATQKITVKKVHVAVSTKHLQDQYLNTYSGANILKGRQNYQCLIIPTSVDNAPCQIGYKCGVINDCDYFKDRKAATGGNYSVFNYALYMGMKKTDMWENPDILFADEAHLIHKEIENHIGVRLSDREIARFGLPSPRNYTVAGMGAWAESVEGDVQAKVEKARRWVLAVTGKKGVQVTSLNYNAAINEYNKCQEMSNKILMLKAAAADSVAGKTWVFERTQYTYLVRPVFVDGYSELMFGGINKVILMSATITRDDVKRLGIQSFRYIEVGSTYPADQRPVVYFPVEAMSSKSEKRVMPKMVNAIDRIIEEHLKNGESGIIHSVSYQRAKEIVSMSRYSSIMITHDSDNKDKAIRDFKQSTKPSVLVSPAIIEGVDFPGDECRFVIIPKVPFIALGDKVVEERMRLDPGWYGAEAMKSIIQGSGRGMRSKSDHCNVYILDKMFEKVFDSNEVPEWYKEGINFEYREHR